MQKRMLMKSTSVLEKGTNHILLVSLILLWVEFELTTVSRALTATSAKTSSGPLDLHEDTIKEDNPDQEADNAILAHEVGDGILDLEVADGAIDPAVMSDILAEIVTLDLVVEAGRLVEVNIHEIAQ